MKKRCCRRTTLLPSDRTVATAKEYRSQRPALLSPSEIVVYACGLGVIDEEDDFSSSSIRVTLPRDRSKRRELGASPS
ncbi:unnamed protein product [Cuscuta europaea]|uniref:Uncharacterized protein n=1 Tax=Cuscuta europaea TaxID=41803 RepID=A0A9P0ZBT6_CUSEU|nr:unnamed protein product [Cuscuta europaea]